MTTYLDKGGEVGPVLSGRRRNNLDIVDAMPRGIRECVHEFGLPIVTVLTKFGILNPQHIREVVREIWNGARQEGQSSGAVAMNTLDVILARGPVSSAMLIRFLRDNNMALISTEPTRAMLDASLREVSGFSVRCTKEEKHRRRLRAAIRAGMKTPQPNVDEGDGK